MICLTILTFAALLVRFLFWLNHAIEQRRGRVKVRIYQKMAENRLDQWELARKMGVDPSFVHGLLTGDQRIDAVAASGLFAAFPQTSVEYWYEIDGLW